MPSKLASFLTVFLSHNRFNPKGIINSYVSRRITHVHSTFDFNTVSQQIPNFGNYPDNTIVYEHVTLYPVSSMEQCALCEATISLGNQAILSIFKKLKVHYRVNERALQVLIFISISVSQTFWPPSLLVLKNNQRHSRPCSRKYRESG